MELPILEGVLTQADKIAVAQTMSTPGWRVILKMLEAECERINAGVIKLNPNDEGHKEKLVAGQLEAWSVNKFAGRVRDSVKYHADSAMDAIQNPVPVIPAAKPQHRFALPIVRQEVKK